MDKQEQAVKEGMDALTSLYVSRSVLRYLESNPKGITSAEEKERFDLYMKACLGTLLHDMIASIGTSVENILKKVEKSAVKAQAEVSMDANLNTLSKTGKK